MNRLLIIFYFLTFLVKAQEKSMFFIENHMHYTVANDVVIENSKLFKIGPEKLISRVALSPLPYSIGYRTKLSNSLKLQSVLRLLDPVMYQSSFLGFTSSSVASSPSLEVSILKHLLNLTYFFSIGAKLSWSPYKGYEFMTVYETDIYLVEKRHDFVRTFWTSLVLELGKSKLRRQGRKLNKRRRIEYLFRYSHGFQTTQKFYFGIKDKNLNESFANSFSGKNRTVSFSFRWFLKRE